MRILRWAVVVGVAGSMGAIACAPAISTSGESIASLEASRTANPNSEPVLRSLGIAYFKANRFDDARTTLRNALALDSKDGIASLYLGLASEAQNDFAGARSAYQSYLAVGKSRRAKSQIQSRLAFVTRKENEAAAKVAIARERELSGAPGPVTTIAVMPFSFTGSDTSLKPLERGFAELITTDLSRVSALKVLERAKLQSLLDEIALQQTVGAQAGSGVRAGKILQAGTIVGGSLSQLDANRLNATAIATNVASSGAMGPGATDQQPLDQLFTLEKNLVLKLLIDNLKITPTTAERNAIEQRPTRSLAAFLSYSRGLAFEDQGRFDAAGRAFDDAVRLDPNFGAAKQKSQQAKGIAAGNVVTVSSVESALGAESSAPTERGNIGAATSIADGLNPSVANGATSSGRTTTPPRVDASTGIGTDRPSTRSTGSITIVVKQP